MEKNCDSCKYREKFIQENAPTKFVYLCVAEEFEESDEGFLIAPEVSEFDSSSCTLFELRGGCE